MFAIGLVLASAALPATAIPCSATQLRLSVGDGGGESGMSHTGTTLSIRNVGRDCTLAALPLVQFRDRRNHILQAVRRPPMGMHPGPIMLPVHLAAGHRAEIDIRWVDGPVYATNRMLKTSRIVVRIGGGSIRAPLAATLYGEAGKTVTFDQTPARAVEGMAAG
jgi:hypothetical protein